MHVIHFKDLVLHLHLRIKLRKIVLLKKTKNEYLQIQKMKFANS